MQSGTHMHHHMDGYDMALLICPAVLISPLNASAMISLKQHHHEVAYKGRALCDIFPISTFSHCSVAVEEALPDNGNRSSDRSLADTE